MKCDICHEEFKPNFTNRSCCSPDCKLIKKRIGGRTQKACCHCGASVPGVGIAYCKKCASLIRRGKFTVVTAYIARSWKRNGKPWVRAPNIMVPGGARLETRPEACTPRDGMYCKHYDDCQDNLLFKGAPRPAEGGKCYKQEMVQPELIIPGPDRTKPIRIITRR